MRPGLDVDIMVLLVTLAMVLFIGMAVLLLVRNHNRRVNHRAELAAFQLARDNEVMQAEREAQQQTLQAVGRELHDNLGQLLTVAQMGVYTVLEDHPSDHRLTEVVNTLEQSIEEVRRLGRSLNSDLWTDRSLSDAITAEAARIERTGIAQVRLLFEGDAPPMTADVKTILFRAFQEVVNNALKHAHARVIDVTLAGTPRFHLTITDDGVGFAVEEVVHGSGLLNIRRRCELIGYRSECTTAPGQGCTWHIMGP